MVLVPKVSAHFSTSLANKITSSAGSMTVVSGSDKAGNALSGLYGWVVDKGSASEEFMLGTISGTTVTITARGLDPGDGKTEVTALKLSHRRGAPVELTDYPILAILARLLNADDTLPNLIKYAALASPSLGQHQIVDWDYIKAYADSIVSSGAPDASTTTKGISKMSVAPASPTAPIAVGDNDPRMPTLAQAQALAGTGTPSGANKFVTADTDAQKELLTNKDTDGTLAGNSDTKYASQKAVKTYIDASNKFKAGIATRAGDTASGSQTIAHGLGVIPKYIRLSANKFVSSEIAESVGTYNGSTTQTILKFSASVVANDTTNGINIYDTNLGTTHQVATVTFDATNITLSWTKAGAPNSNVINILWEAFA